MLLCSVTGTKVEKKELNISITCQFTGTSTYSIDLEEFLVYANLFEA